MRRSLATLDEWASAVASETKRNFHQFRENPAEFENSEPYFRMGMLITVVQQDFQARYNPDRIESPSSPSPNEIFYADSRDLFLHGIVGERRMGTCVSMPVLYVAVARRLGYPVNLVTTKAHLFARWQSHDGKERLNIEGTNKGISCFPDDYYRAWPMPISESEMKACRYLESLTPGEELAVFLATRGECLRSAGRLAEARLGFAHAHALVPQSPEYAFYLAASVKELIGGYSPLPAALVSRAAVDPLAEVEAINRYNREIMERSFPAAMPKPTGVNRDPTKPPFTP